MSGLEKKGVVPAEPSADEKRVARPPEPERLSKLPLEALLYYVLYGDEGLRRLT